MQLALIAPLQSLVFANLGHIYFILVQLCDNEKYVQFYKRKQRFKILDNGFYEYRSAVSSDVLLDAAAKVEADEVVIPDDASDANRNMRLAKDFLSVAPKQYKYMFVPHGKSTAERAESAIKLLAKHPDLTIGLSKLWLKTRLAVAKRILRWITFYNECSNEQIDIRYHLLGFDWLHELRHIRFNEILRKHIRSVDTSFPFSKGEAGQVLRSRRAAPRIDLRGKIDKKLLCRANALELKHLVSQI